MSGDENEERRLRSLTVRELRDLAVKRLGSSSAAALKLKDELIKALSGPGAGASPKAPPPLDPPAAPAAPKVAMPSSLRLIGPATAAPTLAELPVTRDFFVDPRRPGLSTAYGDDRLLCFRRDARAVVVSWDLSPAGFGDGAGLSAELLTAAGRLVRALALGAQAGVATFDELPPGEVLQVQVVRNGRVLSRGAPFQVDALPTPGVAQKQTISWGASGPSIGAPRPWPEAEAQRSVPSRVRASSSRVSS